MEFCNEKAFIAASNISFQKQILQIARRVQEVFYLKQNFIDELIELEMEGEDLSLQKKIKFEQILKNDMDSFLICDQLFKKFGGEFFFLKN